MKAEVLNCKCHGKPYVVCHKCQCQWCAQYWHYCPRCHGTDSGNQIQQMSQCQVIGCPPVKTWSDYRQGCLATFGGGHHSDGKLDAFQHGMTTVFNLLEREFPPAEDCKATASELSRLRADNAKLREALQEWVDDPISCSGSKSKPAGLSRCDCWACQRTLKARAALAGKEGE